MAAVQADKFQQDGIAAKRRSSRALIAGTVVALALVGCGPSGGSAKGTPSPPSGIANPSPAVLGACAGRGNGAAPTTAAVQGIAQSPATGLFHRAMYATTVFGGGSLWLTNQSGRLACLDPGNGRIRAIERLSQSKLVYQLFAADPARHLLFGAGSQGLVAISPPAACWVAAPTPSISG